MRYLSREWKDSQYEAHLDPDSAKWTGCGGLSGPEPCGGCDHCIAAQLSYYIGKEEQRARTFQRAGFEVSDPSLITVDWAPGFGGYHDAYNCWCAKERPELSYPWDNKTTG